MSLAFWSVPQPAVHSPALDCAAVHHRPTLARSTVASYLQHVVSAIQQPSANTPATAAARLCAACGLCCNGVLFEVVRLQPGDSAKELAALGIKLKSRHAQPYFKQPCGAYRSGQCAIYAQRPQRCRLFNCRQILRVAAGERTEDDALETIRQTRDLVARIESLLTSAGDTNVKKPLLKRCRSLLAEPAGPGVTAAWHADLTQAAHALEERLNQDFRVVPVTPEA